VLFAVFVFGRARLFAPPRFTVQVPYHATRPVFVRHLDRGLIGACLDPRQLELWSVRMSAGRCRKVE
jgi:hypothetical protein